jgi:hypothetical protein
LSQLLAIVAAKHIGGDRVAVKKVKKKATVKKAGRPQRTNKKEIQDAICHLISTTSLSLRKILTSLEKQGIENIPTYKCVKEWIANEGEFCAQYVRAKEIQLDIYADEIVEISDDDGLDLGFTEEGKSFINHENINRSRLRVDTRKWLLSKLAPKKYGDKLGLETGDTGPIVLKVIYDNKPQTNGE